MKPYHYIWQEVFRLETEYKSSFKALENPINTYSNQELEEHYWENVAAGYKDEVRCTGEETGLDRGKWSRHYETEEVASKFGDVWVGWTYYSGGGKFGEPEAYDWISEAYFVDCKEKEVVAIQRVFKIKEGDR